MAVLGGDGCSGNDPRGGQDRNVAVVPMVMVGVERFLPGPLDTAGSAIREKTMDRDMFPRTTVRIGLVEHLLDLGRVDLLAALMAFCCRQSRSTVPCKDVQTLQAWCRVSPSWWTAHGTEVMAVVPPLGGGAWGFEDIERAWKAHEKFAEKGMKGGLISGAVRGFEGRRRKRASKRSPASSPASSQLEAVQPQTSARPPQPDPLPPEFPLPRAGAVAGGSPEPLPRVAAAPSPFPAPLRVVRDFYCELCGDTMTVDYAKGDGPEPACKRCPGLTWMVEGKAKTGTPAPVKVALNADRKMHEELARLRANAANVTPVVEVAADKPEKIVLVSTPRAMKKRVDARCERVASKFETLQKVERELTLAKVAFRAKKRTA